MIQYTGDALFSRKLSSRRRYLPIEECDDFLLSMFPTSSKFLALSLSISIVPSTGV